MLIPGHLLQMGVVPLVWKPGAGQMQTGSTEQAQLSPHPPRARAATARAAIRVRTEESAYGPPGGECRASLGSQPGVGVRGEVNPQ